jgi:tetratricopeptide (TPR) repeat protein
MNSVIFAGISHPLPGFIHLIAVLLLAAEISPVPAQDFTGKKITVIKRGAEFKLAETIKGTAWLGESFDVERVKGDWLFVKEKGGYINRSDAVLFDEAPDYFTKKIEKDATARNFNDRGVMWYQRGELEKAAVDYGRAMDLDKSHWMYVKNRCDIWLKLGDLDKVVADCTTAIKHCEEKAEAYFMRGEIFYKKSEVKKASSDFAAALAASPEHSAYTSFRALASSWDGDFENAVKNAQHSVDINSENPWMSRNLAWILATCPDERFRDGKQATEHAKKGCELREWKDHEFLDVLAAAHAELGEFEKAIESETRAISLASANPDAKDVVGIYETRQKLYQEGKKYRDPWMIDGMIEKFTSDAWKGLKTEDLEEAKKSCRRILEYKADHSDTLLIQALIALHEKKFPEAIEGLSKALVNASEKKVGILIARGGVYRDTKEYDKALSDLNLAFEIDPKNLQSLGERATVYAAKRDYDSAIVECTVAIHLATTDLDRSIYHHQRGHLWQDSNEDSVAVVDFAQAARFNPGDGTYWNEAAWLLATSPIDEVRNGDLAIRYALNACEATENPPHMFIDTLAAAYAATGEFEFAFAMENKAISKAGDAADEALMKEYKQRRALYASKKPFLRTAASQDSTQPNLPVEPVAPITNPAANLEAK